MDNNCCTPQKNCNFLSDIFCGNNCIFIILIAIVLLCCCGKGNKSSNCNNSNVSSNCNNDIF